MLFHVSEEPHIRRFDPRPSPYTPYDVVWGVDEDRLRNYLLPRDCPRVTFYAGRETSAADTDKFLGSSKSVVAFETCWLDRVKSAQLFLYHLPPDSFRCLDECAGYFVSRQAVFPDRVETCGDLLAALSAREVEIRVLPSLWELHDEVGHSTLQFSMIRMRNASRRK